MWAKSTLTAAKRAGLPARKSHWFDARGHGSMSSVSTIVIHHTAGVKSGDAPSERVVAAGRAGLPGPLAQVTLARSGTVILNTYGVAYHAGAVANTLHSNWNALGIECENTGLVSDPWPADQYKALVRLVGELCKAHKVPVSRVLGHREIAVPRGRKIDPTYSGAFKSMDRFRADVAAYLKPAPKRKATTSDTVLGRKTYGVPKAERRGTVKPGVTALFRDVPGGRVLTSKKSGTYTFDRKVRLFGLVWYRLAGSKKWAPRRSFRF